jgi:hypothetical protein
MNTNKSPISTDEIYALLSQNIEISNSCIDDKIELRKIAYKEYINNTIIFKNCIINELDAGYLFFNTFVSLEQCIIKIAIFEASYLLAGLTIKECIFLDDLSLMSMGGHNKLGKPISIRDCIFHGFVNFFDAWFEGPFEVSRCHFIKGTNLLGNKDEPYVVNFSVAPVISENLGELDINIR